MNMLETDCLIIGTGISGCAAAMEAAQKGIDVLLVTRAKDPGETASAMAQGGIVYQSDTEDRDQLFEDILGAGAGIGNRPAIEILTKEGPELVERILIKELKIRFDRNESGGISLAGEAAHSVPRILHIGDQTGQDMEKAFLNDLKGRKNVTVLSSHTAIDLLTLAHHSKNAQDFYKRPRCVGAYVYDQKKKAVKTILAKETVLATGGLGQLYLHSTNPPAARGDGLAMAYRTGARIMNLEYVQFHPTALYRKTSERPLISEALRGEGARLVNHAGKEFMKRYDRRGALAPRDIVARGIHDEILREGIPWVYLDISHKKGEWIRKRFPWAYKECKRYGIDITKEPVPVVPAAHYSCGGVAVDLDGNTTIENLKAIGEVACTGVHGANRLASTSLLEDLVWGVRAGRDLVQRIEKGKYRFPGIRPWKGEKEEVDWELMAQDWLTIKHTMWNYVGLVRTPKRLDRADRIFGELGDEVRRFYSNSLVSDDLIGLRNGVLNAKLICTAARRNRQSLGCHYVREE